ncbi:transmembrane emp24 domain-containing protein-like [Hydractinia symbiolongicarpus]|uniref:transmembrane emp24 domain-containing protein-like n=1 Tax=Hydractinia symbiolongicarpus TaxID=13093 RepID=UPI00254CF4AB|nr:transmembrane emp24 domain-containing protein-like [Hydractinia symbiolongicarpus]
MVLKEFLYASMLILVLQYCHGNSLSIIIPANRQDCLYMEKEHGDRMFVDVQITEGRKIGIRLIGPRQEIIHNEEKVDGLRLNEKVSAPGEYAFCFLNTHSYTEPVTVHFEYDMHEEDGGHEARLDKQIKAEKRKFVLKQMEKMKPKNQIERAAHAYETQKDDIDNSTMGAIQETLTLLSLNLDTIDTHMRRSTAKMAFSHYLQKQNNSWVAYFSFATCLLIIAMGCIQVIVLKGLFNGKMSLKIWQF